MINFINFTVRYNIFGLSSIIHAKVRHLEQLFCLLEILELVYVVVHWYKIQRVFPGSQLGCQWLNSSWLGMRFPYVVGTITLPQPGILRRYLWLGWCPCFSARSFPRYSPFSSPEFFQGLWKPVNVPVSSPEFTKIFPFTSPEFFRWCTCS